MPRGGGIVWDFHKDCHGGFQAVHRRMELLEGLRTAAGMLAVILSYAGVGHGYLQVVLVGL